MKEDHGERREKEEEMQEEGERREKKRQLKTSSRRSDEEDQEEKEKEEKEMTVDTKAGAQTELNGGHPLFAFSFNSSPFLSSSYHQGRGEEEDEVRVSIVTIKDESCPSEPFGTTHLETTSEITKKEEGGHKEEEEEAEEKEGETRDDDGEEEELTWLHLQSQVGPQSSACVECS